MGSAQPPQARPWLPSHGPVPHAPVPSPRRRRSPCLWARLPHLLCVHEARRACVWVARPYRCRPQPFSTGRTHSQHGTWARQHAGYNTIATACHHPTHPNRLCHSRATPPRPHHATSHWPPRRWCGPVALPRRGSHDATRRACLISLEQHPFTRQLRRPATCPGAVLAVRTSSKTYVHARVSRSVVPGGPSDHRQA